ncbi:MAG: SRPBCC family protein [Pyrinomonadaceae bacterium]
MLKKILIAIGSLILIVIAALIVLVIFVPGGYKVEREIVINKPQADVYAYAHLLKNQNEWGPWVKKDPNIKLTYSGTDGTPGFTSAWDSQIEDVGAGEQVITAESQTRMETLIRFLRPFRSESNAYLTYVAVNDTQTKVTWGFTGKMPRPFNLFVLFMNMDDAVGKDFDEGLANLKAIIEKQ